ncbi:MAG: pitrilysin family protein [bacterium]
MKVILKVLFMLLIVALPLSAQVDRSKMPEPGQAPEIKIGDYESFELSNGLKVFVVENDKVPRVTFSLVLNTDPVLEGENAGYINTAGQLLGTSTKTRTKDQLDEEIDFLGASFYTSATSVYGASLKKHSEKLMEIMADVILNPVFTQEELDKIKKQTISGLAAAKDDPNSIAANLVSGLVYGKGHPYGELVTEESVEKITLDMCNNYFNTYWSPSVAYLAIVGDITKSEAQNLVEKYLSGWVKKDVPKHEYKTPKAPLVNKVAIVDRPQAVQSVIHIAYAVELPIGGEDAIPVSVLNMILGGNFSSRFNMNLREKHGFTYGARSSLGTDRLVSRFDASCEGRNSITDSAVTEFINEMKKIKNEPVTAEELNSTKNFMTGTFARSLEEPETVADFALNIERYNLSKDYYKNYLKNLNAVTIEDIQRVAKKYIKPDKAYIIVVGSAEEVGESLKKFSVSGKVNYYDMYANEYDPSAKKIPEGMTVRTVLDNYINAIGGKETILKVKDRTIVLSGSVQGMTVTVTMKQKEPNKFYQLIDAGVFKQETIFDGVKGKTIAMGQATDMPTEQVEQMKLQSGMYIFLDYPAAGITPELSGVESIGGKDAYKITLNMPNGEKSFQYFDMQSGLLVREIQTMNSPQGSFTSTIDYFDYKPVEGMLYAFKYTQQMGPQTINLDATSILVNSGLTDDIFTIK